MRRLRKAPGRRYEHGVVAIEMAAVLPLLVLFITFPSVALAFYYRQYSAAQKAVHDAALYLATAPRVEVITTGPDGNFAALTVARKIVEMEMAGLVPASVPVDPAIFCIYQVSGSQRRNHARSRTPRTSITPCFNSTCRSVSRTSTRSRAATPGC